MKKVLRNGGCRTNVYLRKSYPSSHLVKKQEQEGDGKEAVLFALSTICDTIG